MWSRTSHDSGTGLLPAWGPLDLGQQRMFPWDMKVSGPSFRSRDKSQIRFPCYKIDTKRKEEEIDPRLSNRPPRLRAPMSSGLTGYVALVTGARQGIGAGIATAHTRGRGGTMGVLGRPKTSAELRRCGVASPSPRGGGKRGRSASVSMPTSPTRVTGRLEGHVECAYRPEPQAE